METVAAAKERDDGVETSSSTDHTDGEGLSSYGKIISYGSPIASPVLASTTSRHRRSIALLLISIGIIGIVFSIAFSVKNRSSSSRAVTSEGNQSSRTYPPIRQTIEPTTSMPTRITTMPTPTGTYHTVEPTIVKTTPINDIDAETPTPTLETIQPASTIIPTTLSSDNNKTKKCINTESFNSGFGPCDTYEIGGINHMFCYSSTDEDQNGISARDACPGCGYCTYYPSTLSPTTSRPTIAIPSLTSTPSPATDTPTPLATLDRDEQICINTESFNSGFGPCSTYEIGGINHAFCSTDTDKDGVVAERACPGCGVCNVSSPITTSRPTSAAPVATAAPIETTVVPVTDSPTPAPIEPTVAPVTDSPTPAPIKLTTVPVTDNPTTTEPAKKPVSVSDSTSSSLRAPGTSTSHKVVFDEYPITAIFRSPPRNRVASYEDFKNKQFLPEGYTVDLQTNVLRLAPENYKYANQFAKENPKMVILSIWKAASGNPKGTKSDGDPLGESVIEFPGHFVCGPGTYVSNDITPTSKKFQVTNGAKIAASLDGRGKSPALLVETNEKGNKIWDKYEYILIESLDGNKVNVRRAFNGSPPARSFPPVSTYLAPIRWDFRATHRYTDWFFNLSKDCPEDSQGNTAMSVILTEMTGPLKEGRDLQHLGGLDLASAPLIVNPTNADYNLDGIADSPRMYRDGVKAFYERIRKNIGNEKLLLTSLDAETGLGLINGANQEGLARPYDPWKFVSRTVNSVLAWQKLSDLPMASLAFQQYQDSNPIRVQLTRLLNGYAACLGMAARVHEGKGLHLLERMELFKGDEKEQHWLGKSVGSLLRPALLEPNLLLNYKGTSSNDWSGMMQSLDTIHANLLVDDNELVIRPTGKGNRFVSLVLKFELTQKSDFTVYMEATSDDDRVVRHIKLPRINTKVETEGVRAFISNVDYLPISYLIRRADASSSVRFELRIENGGDIRIRNLSIHAFTDALACQFENGVVLVNPSF